jgi:hypothetical protein
VPHSLASINSGTELDEREMVLKRLWPTETSVIRASKIELWPTKSNDWPRMTRTDLDSSIYSLVARVDEPFFIASRPSRFINWDHRYQTMSSDSRIALFIDGANLYATAKALGFDIDYRRLLKEFRSRAGVMLRAFYYTAVIEDQEYTSIRPLIDWLDYNELHRRHQGDQGIH